MTHPCAVAATVDHFCWWPTYYLRNAAAGSRGRGLDSVTDNASWDALPVIAVPGSSVVDGIVNHSSGRQT